MTFHTGATNGRGFVIQVVYTHDVLPTDHTSYPMKSLRRFALRARYVFPVAETPVADGCVVVEGSRIVFVGVGDSWRRLDVENVFDLGNVAILPGLVNTHAHLEFSDLAAPLGNRGIGFVDWIRMVIGHRRLTTVSPEEAIVAGLNESLCHGVTTIADIVQPDQSPVDFPLDVIQFLELKAFTTDGVACAMEQAKFHVVGGDSCRRCGGSRLHNRRRESPPTTACLVGLCPHAPHTVHPDLLKAVAELSAAERVPVAMHLAESTEEMEFLRNSRGPFRDLLKNIGIEGGTLTDHHSRPLDYLRQLAETHRSLVIHGNYLDDEEIAFLGENASRMSAVYCPRSHDWFAHADYPLRKMLSAGATVALGTDGRCSTPDLSLLEEMRFAARRHTDVGMDEILRMGTLGGASALGRDREIGSLTPGKLADLAIVALPNRDADDPHELIFDSPERVVGCYCRGVSVIKPRPSVAPNRVVSSSPSSATDGRGFMDCWYLTGPTASGKSAVGVELARRIGAEIISLDSMALYRRMDIGTAKPTEIERCEVPHHLIDVIEPWEEYSLAKYVEEAKRIAEEISNRGKQVLFVGGTPLYLKGLLRGIFEGPPADWPLRRRLAEEARAEGDDWLHCRLAEVDPVSAARLHPNDARRLIRALEVYEKTGSPISELQRQFDTGRPAEECRVFVLDWPREELYARIDRRVDKMFAAGLVKEVRRLLAASPLFQEERGESLSHTASQAVGYREVIDHIEGRQDLPETIELVRRHTRQLAKRQMTWFRSLSECRFIPVSDRFDAEEIAEKIALPA